MRDQTPAGSAWSRSVATTVPAELRMVQMTVPGRARVNEMRDPFATPSRSCGKNSVLLVVTDPSRLTTSTERVTPLPALRAASIGVSRTSYVPSGTTVPSLALPSHVTATLPAGPATVNVRTVVSAAFRTRTATEPFSEVTPLRTIVSRTPSRFGENAVAASAAGVTSVRLGAFVSTRIEPVVVSAELDQASLALMTYP